MMKYMLYKTDNPSFTNIICNSDGHNICYKINGEWLTGDSMKERYPVEYDKAIEIHKIIEISYKKLLKLVSANISEGDLFLTSL